MALASDPVAVGRTCGGHLKAYEINRREMFNVWFPCKFREALKSMYVFLNPTLYSFDIYSSINFRNPQGFV